MMDIALLMSAEKEMGTSTNMQVFSSVNVETPPVVGTPDQIDVNYKVEEKASVEVVKLPISMPFSVTRHFNNYFYNFGQPWFISNFSKKNSQIQRRIAVTIKFNNPIEKSIVTKKTVINVN